ncbi:uncharacterized protein LOC143858224 [Tasmannia lanceolata]|uniref:uncharacterized protein LOC143858224 n=1 Tax=Tasmannia lanceolata TaxID=3420 RepID=UPI004062D101
MASEDSSSKSTVDGASLPPSSHSSSAPYTPVEAPLQMTSIKLDGQNHPPWRRVVRTYLLGRGKVHFIESASPATTDPSYARWEHEDVVIRSFLLSVMEPQVAANMMYLGSSKEVWDHAATLYSGADNVTRMCGLFSDWLAFNRGEMTTADHYSSYVALCQQLDLLMPFTVDPVVLAKRQENLRIVRYLDSLGPDYLQLRQQIVGSGSLPSLADTFSRVHRMRATPASTPHIDGFALATYTGGDRGRGFRRFGRGLGRFGRGRNGGSRGRGYDGAGRGRGRDSGGGRGCGSQLLRRCNSIALVAASDDTHPPHPAPTGSPSSDSMVVSRADYEELLRIRDKGASHHMTGNSHILSSFQLDISRLPPTVTLVDRTKSPVSGDMKTGTRIGLSREVGGLYYLDSTTAGVALRTSVDAYQWHCRLGHPLAEKLQKSPFLTSSVESLSCEQNGVAERKLQYLLDMIRMLMLQMRVPKYFWGDAALTDCFLANRLPSSLSGSTPFYVLLPSGYKCYSSHLQKTFVSADMTFFEDTSYFLAPPPSPVEVPSLLLPLSSIPVEPAIVTPFVAPDLESTEAASKAAPILYTRGP